MTLIVPAYNEDGVIEKSLTSIDSQLLLDKLHVLVILNGCTDNTENIARSVIKRSKNLNISWDLHVLTEGNKIKALNYGLNKTTTNLVAIMDSDSWIEPNTISLSEEKMKNNPSLMVLGAIHKPDFSRSVANSLLVDFQKILYYNLISNSLKVPIGRYMVIRGKENAMVEIGTPAEDSYVAIKQIAAKGEESVHVDEELIVNYYPVLNWVDFIKQESRFIRGTELMFEKYPDLKKAFGLIQEKHKQNQPERLRKIAQLMKENGILAERMHHAKDIILPILMENSQMMKNTLYSENGIWERISSTK